MFCEFNLRQGNKIPGKFFFTRHHSLIVVHNGL